jgi:hypothetical protein
VSPVQEVGGHGRSGSLAINAAKFADFTGLALASRVMAHHAACWAGHNLHNP